MRPPPSSSPLSSTRADALINQHDAVTGSFGHRGATQAIGGVDEKVVSPRRRTTHLMPPRAVVAAAPAGSFNVWPIATLDEGLALHTGRSATEIHARAEARLAEFAALAREFADRRR